MASFDSEREFEKERASLPRESLRVFDCVIASNAMNLAARRFDH
jgi:hypothetical protein